MKTDLECPTSRTTSTKRESSMRRVLQSLSLMVMTDLQLRSAGSVFKPQTEKEMNYEEQTALTGFRRRHRPNTGGTVLGIGLLRGSSAQIGWKRDFPSVKGGLFERCLLALSYVYRKTKLDPSGLRLWCYSNRPSGRHLSIEFCGPQLLRRLRYGAIQRYCWKEVSC